jgi:hypothetical protein
MTLDFFKEFRDPYLHSHEGQGVFLAGVCLGQLATRQIQNGGKIDDAPLFKQMNFGKMTMRELHRHLSRVPELTRAYHLGNAATLEKIMSKAGTLLFQAGSDEMGIKGNFAFTVAFMNSYEYIKKMFQDNKEEE